MTRELVVVAAYDSQMKWAVGLAKEFGLREKFDMGWPMGMGWAWGHD